jgi:hypothetical protein
MASLLIKAEKLSVGDVLLLPFGREATIERIRPRGAKAIYVNFKTEYGWTRVELDDEVNIKAKVHG